jgi:hypothetical protein
MKKNKNISINDIYNEPDLILDILDSLLKDYSNEIQSLIVDDNKLLQFREVSKTIDRLKESGASVPDELRQLKIQLSELADLSKKANEKKEYLTIKLNTIEKRISGTITQVRAIISRNNSENNVPKNKKRYVKRTSPDILAKELRKAIRQLGGSARKSQVLHLIERNMQGKFKVQDLERDNQGNVNWHKWVVLEKGKMVKSGVMKTGSPFGIWELRR